MPKIVAAEHVLIKMIEAIKEGRELHFSGDTLMGDISQMALRAQYDELKDMPEEQKEELYQNLKAKVEGYTSKMFDASSSSEDIQTWLDANPEHPKHDTISSWNKILKDNERIAHVTMELNNKCWDRHADIIASINKEF